MKAFKTIFSAFLAPIVLLSGMSFTIDKHVCMGRVQSVAILHDASPCAMELFAESGENLSKMEGCCRDEQVKFEGKELQVKTIKPVAVEYQSLWIAELPKLIEVFEFNYTVLSHSRVDHIPPLIDREIPILVQSFLI